MLETFTILTTCVILLIIFRPGTPPPLENPLTINRLGQFHAVLAPRINLAQPLLENISRRFTDEQRQNGNTPTLYFKVQDKEVKSHGDKFYLLAATLRDGMLYFQAAGPEKDKSDLEVIQAFSSAELAKHEETRPKAESAVSALTDAIRAAADQRGAAVAALS